eukprot:11877127-Ditylum_brightwellii.AAC.1
MDWTHLCHGFKIWNERTATSPLGRYLGKYKAWIRKQEVEKREQAEGNEISQEEFFTTINNVLRTAM